MMKFCFVAKNKSMQAKWCLIHIKKINFKFFFEYFFEFFWTKVAVNILRRAVQGKEFDFYILMRINISNEMLLAIHI